jgi:penicillin-binding protein 1A
MARKAISKVLTDPSGPQAALVAIEPRTGSVRAMVGGSSYRRASSTSRCRASGSPGSGVQAVRARDRAQRGISPSTHFTSHPVVIPLGDKLWQVNNYEGEYLGSIDLTSATVHSGQLGLRAADLDRRAHRTSRRWRATQGSRAS